jgi:hypothetical protein
LSKLSKNRVLFETLQDNFPELDDHYLQRILETLDSEGVSQSKNSISGTRVKGVLGEFSCDRKTAVDALRKLGAARDPDVVQIRGMEESFRKKLLASIIQRAKVGGTIKEPNPPGSGVVPVIRLPGFVQERPDESLFLPLSDFEDINLQLMGFFTRLTTIAARISHDYSIDPDYSLIYLLLGKGYRAKARVTWVVRAREDRPGLTSIQMSIDPWTSPEEVAAEYAKARSASGHSGLRAQREKTYFLAERFATYALFGLIDPDNPDWRRLRDLWDMFCEDHGRYDWSHFVKGRLHDQDLYQFTRDVKHAIGSLSDTTEFP